MARGRYAYVTPDFALGSATADYPVNGNIELDLTTAASLVSSPMTPLLAVLPDWLDAPLTPIAAGDFTKATHLPLDPALVQKRGDLLLLERVPAQDPMYGVPLVNLTSNLIAPASVDAVLVDGKMIDPTQAGSASARPVLVVQNQTGVIGMAVLDASGIDCVTSAGAITETGSSHTDVLPLPVPNEGPAVRLAIRHLDAPPADASTLDGCFARLALLVIARHCGGATCGATLSADLETAAAAARSAFDRTTGTWDITVQAPGGATLHVTRGTAAAGDVRATQADGVTPTFSILAVNGAAVSLAP
jgi:hypothetical protein